MQFSYIPIEAIGKVPKTISYLKTVEPYLLPRCDAFDVYLMCLSGEATLWGVFTDDVTPDTLNECLVGVVVTKITIYPKGSILTITALAGDDLDAWISIVYGTLTRYWKENNLLGLEEWGRDGWIRKLKKFGFRKSLVLMEDFDGQGLIPTADSDDLDGHSDQSS